MSRTTSHELGLPHISPTTIGLREEEIRYWGQQEREKSARKKFKKAGRAALKHFRHSTERSSDRAAQTLREELEGKKVKAKGSPLVSVIPDEVGHTRKENFYATHFPKRLPKGKLRVVRVVDVDDYCREVPFYPNDAKDHVSGKSRSRAIASAEGYIEAHVIELKDSPLSSSVTLAPIIEFEKDDSRYFVLATEITDLEFVA